MTSPINQEQDICKSCGFCCDGTLFNKAKSYKGEVLLPKMAAEMIDDEYWFKLPCEYFDKYCTVYKEKRPNICGDFKCRLLKKFSKGKMDFTELKNLIQQIKSQKRRFYKLIPNAKTHQQLQEAYLSFLKTNQN